MIAKGTTHNNGLKLAQYITTGKGGERAELWKLVGFASPDIKQAFRCVHVMAEATKCEQPFFHVQVRNREGEKLTREQWEIAAHRIMRINGLTGQPFAIAFHINEITGEEHMHLAVSLIDAESMTAKRLPFFELRLKRVSRELEKEFELEPVRNEREGSAKQAPTRGEYEQARRLGVNLDELDNTIRDCWKHSDNGRSFRDALEHEGLILAEGDRRSSLVVIDYAGGVHALGKRILGVTPGQIKARTSDLDRNELPSVQEAKEFILENAHERQQPDKLDRLKSELAEVQKLQAEVTAQQREKPAPVWDRDRDNAAWEKAVMNAAIEHEKVERRFVEPRQKEARAGREQAEVGGRKKVWPINPPQPERKSPGLFEKAATEATRDDRTENLTGPAAQVWQAWQHSDSAKAYAAALDDKGIAFARTTKQEADRSHREAEFAKAVGNYAPRFKEGEIVIVTEARPEYRRDGELTERRRVHKLDQSLAAKFVKGLDDSDRLQGIDATMKASDQRAQQRAADWEAIRHERATNIRRGGRTRAGNVKDNLAKSPAAILKPVAMGLNVIGKPLQILENVFEGVFAPKLTPEQIREGEIAARERQADVRDQLEDSNAIARRAQERQQEEQREAARQREERERYGGGRER